MVTVCLADVRFRSTHVLLKPNLISARHGPLACTEVAFILATARWFVDQGARVCIGDSPAFGTASGVLAKLGIVEQLRSLSVPITDFDRVNTVTLASGKKAGLAADAMDCDLLINLPRIKAHAQLRVTLAVKNMFGCLVGMRKPWWHMAYGGHQGEFESLLVELMTVLPDSLTIVDGITAMSGTGPIGGHPCHLGLMAASTNPVAVDSALLSALGLDPDVSPLWRACRDAGLPGVRFNRLDFPLQVPQDFQVTDFSVPEELSPIRFNPFRFVSGSFKRALGRLHQSCRLHSFW